MSCAAAGKSNVSWAVVVAVKKKNKIPKTSVVAWWLRQRASTAEGQVQSLEGAK